MPHRLVVFTLPLLFVLAITAFTSWNLTGLVRRFALSRNVLDVPNARSSHKLMTPPGGGIAFGVAFIVWGRVSTLTWVWPKDVAAAFLGSGVIVAVAGFMNDHHHIAARWGLFAYFSAAGWALYVHSL